jgi:hypothetical protein
MKFMSARALHCVSRVFHCPCKIQTKYRVIHKSLRDFRPLRCSSWDGNAKGEHVNRGRDSKVSVLPYKCSICPPLVTRQMSVLYSSSTHTRCNIWRSIVATASMILHRSCGKSRGIEGMCVRAPMPRGLPCVAGT